MPKTQETMGWNSIDMILLFQEKLIKHAIGEKNIFFVGYINQCGTKWSGHVFLLECNDYFTFKVKKQSLDGALLFF
jgi:hypothetical protein